jgi:hypothetical protein
MAIVAADIEFRMSGGAANTDVNAALGGAMSTVGGGLIATNVLNNDMDDMTSAEAAAGRIIYHCYFLKNTHSTLSTLVGRVYFSSLTNSATTEVDMAIAGEAKNTAAETVTPETSAPAGESFTRPTNYAGGLSVVDLATNDYKGLWIKYDMTAGTTVVLDQYTFDFQFDSNP